MQIHLNFEQSEKKNWFYSNIFSGYFTAKMVKNVYVLIYQFIEKENSNNKVNNFMHVYLITCLMVFIITINVETSKCITFFNMNI